MRFRRLTLVANVVIIGATLPAVGLPVATSSSGALPLYEYTNGFTASSWRTQPLAGELRGHSILGRAHGTSGDGEVALVARIDNGDLGLYVKNASGTTSFHDVTALTRAPRAGADPNIFLDPWGNVDVIYVSTSDRLVLISNALARSPRHANIAGPSNSPYVVTDLTAASHVPMTPGLPSVAVSGMSAEIFDRSSKGDAIAIPVQWHQLSITPQIGVATNVTLATNSPTLLNDPVAIAGVTNAFAATTRAGHVEFFTQAVANVSPWSVSDVSALNASGTSTGPLSAATNGPQIYVASLSSSNHAQLFSIATSSVSSATVGLSRLIPRIANLAPGWKYTDLTASIAGSPLWAGNVFVSATTTTVNVAGRAQNWGDLYDDSEVLATTTWTSNDISQDAGSTTSAASSISGMQNGASVQLFATSDGALSPHGVGVYAIPSNDWSRAITDGWPIISETGGLGTLNAPWVGFMNSPSVVQSADFQMGRSILASKKRETWLSFWTVSGPLTPGTQTLSSYYSHGFLAGQWVAQQIDQYRLHGVNIKPNWVILDPEGYPDNHSALDAPGGSSQATIHKYAAFWSAMLRGWSTGINDVDPSLHPGIYAEQSEYANYGLTNLSIPVFEAIAFGGGGPVRIARSNGHNILGYIAFNGACTPSTTLHAQERTLLNPPWSGQFNTLQFNAGVYCAP